MKRFATARNRRKTTKKVNRQRFGRQRWESPGAGFRCVPEDDGHATIRAVAAARLVNSVADSQELRGYIHRRAPYVKDVKWRL
jgi:hypothetical protein